MKTHLALDVTASFHGAGAATLRAYVPPATPRDGALRESACILRPGPQAQNGLEEPLSILFLLGLRVQAGVHAAGCLVRTACLATHWAICKALNTPQIFGVPVPRVALSVGWLGVVRRAQNHLGSGDPADVLQLSMKPAERGLRGGRTIELTFFWSTSSRSRAISLHTKNQLSTRRAEG